MKETFSVNESKRQALISKTSKTDSQYRNVMAQRKVYKHLTWIMPLLVILSMCVIWFRGGVNIEGLITILIMCPVLGICFYLIYRSTFTMRRLLSKSAALDCIDVSLELDKNEILYSYRHPSKPDDVFKVQIRKDSINYCDYDEETEAVSFYGTFERKQYSQKKRKEKIVQIRKISLYDFFSPSLIEALHQNQYL